MHEPTVPEPEPDDGAQRTIRQILSMAAPLAAAVGVFGVSFGILARSAGFGVVAPIL